MEATTFTTEKNLNYILYMLNDTEFYNTTYFVYSSAIFLDKTVLKSELISYFMNKDFYTLDAIFEDAVVILKKHEFLDNLPKSEQGIIKHYKMPNGIFLKCEKDSYDDVDKESIIGCSYDFDYFINYCFLAVNYIEQLRKQEEPKKNKIKAPKLNEFNKPILSQVQISMLFKILMTKKIFTNRDIVKKSYSKILQLLTGYSENTIRNDLSSVNLIDISTNKTDYEVIISKLEEIIKEMKKAIKDISG